MAILLGGYVVTDHALSQARRRGIDLETLKFTVIHPDQLVPLRAGREIRQRRLELDGRTFIIRVVVDIDRSPAEIVTAYRSSKIAKYWRSSP